MDEQELDARARATVEAMHPKMRDLAFRRWMEPHLQEFMEEMVRQGRAERDPETGHFRMIGEGFPPPDLKAFLHEKLEKRGREE